MKKSKEFCKLASYIRMQHSRVFILSYVQTISSLPYNDKNSFDCHGDLHLFIYNMWYLDNRWFLYHLSVFWSQMKH